MNIKRVEITQFTEGYIPSVDSDKECCSVMFGPFHCTREANHAGNHVAHGLFDTMIAIGEIEDGSGTEGRNGESEGIA